LLNLLDKFNEKELLEIPEGFNNNILWNAGHIVTTQQRICYGLAGVQLSIPKEYGQLFGKDSSPRTWNETPNISELKRLLADTDTIINDYKNGLLKNYKPYETSYGFFINNIEDGIAFNNIHEAMHISAARSISKLVKKTTF